MSFENFDDFISLDDLKGSIDEIVKDIESKNFDTVPNGEYIVRFEGMELGTTNDGRPMFKVMARLIEAVSDNEASEDNTRAINFLKHFKEKKPCIFMNKVIYGTKSDAKMIANVVSWLKKLQSSFEIEFNSYTDFERLIFDVFGEIEKNREYHIKYKEDGFNTITIKAGFEV